MPEFLHDEDETRVQYIRPDEDGFTIRTNFKDTQVVLDQNARLRAGAPATFKEDGVTFHHVARVPVEVVEILYHRLGRMPTAKELLQLSQERDYSKLRTRDVKLTGNEGKV